MTSSTIRASAHNTRTIRFIRRSASGSPTADAVVASVTAAVPAGAGAVDATGTTVVGTTVVAACDGTAAAPPQPAPSPMPSPLSRTSTASTEMRRPASMPAVMNPGVSRAEPSTLMLGAGERRASTHRAALERRAVPRAQRAPLAGDLQVAGVAPSAGHQELQTSAGWCAARLSPPRRRACRRGGPGPARPSTGSRRPGGCRCRPAGAGPSARPSRVHALRTTSTPAAPGDRQRIGPERALVRPQLDAAQPAGVLQRE